MVRQSEGERNFHVFYYMLCGVDAAQKAKLHSAWADGLWEMSAPKAKKEVDELRAFAKSKGL